MTSRGGSTAASTSSRTALLKTYLELALLSILRVRGVYPTESFYQVSAFGASGWRSLDPAVQKYVENIAAGLDKWHREGVLLEVQVQLFRRDSVLPVEEFVFNFRQSPEGGVGGGGSRAACRGGGGGGGGGDNSSRGPSSVSLHFFRTLFTYLGTIGGEDACHSFRVHACCVNLTQDAQYLNDWLGDLPHGAMPGPGESFQHLTNGQTTDGRVMSVFRKVYRGSEPPADARDGVDALETAAGGTADDAGPGLAPKTHDRSATPSQESGGDFVFSGE
jgi:hypothetical protein